MLHSRIFKMIVVMMAVGGLGCQKPKSSDVQSIINHVDRVDRVDHCERFNRSIYAFNKTTDRVVIKPIARIYEGLIPKPMRLMVSNFFQNLSEIPSMGNDLLQVNLAGFRTDCSRFLINSTWGIGGLIDWSSKKGLVVRKQDFGLTLAHWGYINSSYIVLPFLGPSTIRDGIGRMGTYYMNVPAYLKPRWRNPMMALNFVESRTSLLKVDPLLREAIDEYIFVREAYLQNRHAQINAFRQVQQNNDSSVVTKDIAVLPSVLEEPPE